MHQENTVTVGQLNRYLKTQLDGNAFLQQVAVQGEISNYRPNTSGHLYFSLKDETGSIRCVMFRSAAERLRFRPEDGLRVVARGAVTVYPRDGNCQINVSALTADGVGDLYLAFEQLKTRLEAEGLFDPAKKKALPLFPRMIGIVTSPTGAAIRDMLRILKHRYPAARILIVPVKVQGEGAAEEIADGIRRLNRKMYVDLIITGRGGGSMEDLWCFNEEIVARAIAASRIPVISAVGHEPDVTIADYTADLRAATPSNAAELAVPDQFELRERFKQLSAVLEKQMLSKLALLHQRTEAAAAHPSFVSPLRYFDDRRQYTDAAAERFAAAWTRIYTEQDNRLRQAAAQLDALSPLQVLSRGYAIAKTEDGLAVRNAETLTPGDTLHLRFAEGRAVCAVQSTETDA